MATSHAGIRKRQEVTKVTRKVHEEAVNLAQDVLPVLQKIGASALGFAVVSWTYSFLWLFGFVAVDFDKILKHWAPLAEKKSRVRVRDRR